MSALGQLLNILEDEAQRIEKERETVKNHVLVGYDAPVPEELASYMSILFTTINIKSDLNFKKYSELFFDKAEIAFNDSERKIMATWDTEVLRVILMPLIILGEHLKINPDKFYEHMIMLMKDEIRHGLK